MISRKLISNKFFVKLLLTTSPTQGYALLDTLLDRQVSVLCEILFNLLELPHTQKKALYISQKQKWIRNVIDKHHSTLKTKKLITKHKKKIWDVLQTFRKVLLDTLE